MPSEHTANSEEDSGHSNDIRVVQETAANDYFRQPKVRIHDGNSHKDDDLKSEQSCTSAKHSDGHIDDLPVEPEGVERIFHEFTQESYARLVAKEIERKRKQERKGDEDNEGRLVDGEIVFDYDTEDHSLKITRDPKLADGQPLPEKLGRFPKELDGVPLEEIDPHIEEKVSKRKLLHVSGWSWQVWTIDCLWKGNAGIR